MTYFYIKGDYGVGIVGVYLDSKYPPCINY